MMVTSKIQKMHRQSGQSDILLNDINMFYMMIYNCTLTALALPTRQNCHLQCHRESHTLVPWHDQTAGAAEADPV